MNYDVMLYLRRKAVSNQSSLIVAQRIYDPLLNTNFVQDVARFIVYHSRDYHPGLIEFRIYVEVPKMFHFANGAIDWNFA